MRASTASRPSIILKPFFWLTESTRAVASVIPTTAVY